MDKVFFDLNILIDILLKRKEFYANSSNCLIKTLTSNSYISSCSLTTLFYFGKEQRITKEVFHAFLKQFNIIGTNPEIIRNAFDLPINDFEDSMQISSALESCNIFLTRDKKGFSKVRKKIQIMSPHQYLN